MGASFLRVPLLFFLLLPLCFFWEGGPLTTDTPQNNAMILGGFPYFPSSQAIFVFVLSFFRGLERWRFGKSCIASLASFAWLRNLHGNHIWSDRLRAAEHQKLKTHQHTHAHYSESSHNLGILRHLQRLFGDDTCHIRISKQVQRDKVRSSPKTACKAGVLF